MICTYPFWCSCCYAPFPCCGGSCSGGSFRSGCGGLCCLYYQFSTLHFRRSGDSRRPLCCSGGRHGAKARCCCRYCCGLFARIMHTFACFTVSLKGHISRTEARNWSSTILVCQQAQMAASIVVFLARIGTCNNKIKSLLIHFKFA